MDEGPFKEDPGRIKKRYVRSVLRVLASVPHSRPPARTPDRLGTSAHGGFVHGAEWHDRAEVAGGFRGEEEVLVILAGEIFEAGA